MFQDKVKLGPCTLVFGGLNIDLTHGGVTLHVGPITKPLHADQYGEGPADHVITGWDIKAIVPLAQTDYDSIKGVAKFLTETESGKLQDRPIGASMRASGEQLTLHPLEDPSGDSDTIFYLCAPITAMELAYGYQDQRVYNVEFQAYPKDGADPAQPGNFFELGGVPGGTALYTTTFTVTESVGSNPIANAKITFAGSNVVKYTDSAGVATVDLADGEYMYSVEHSLYDTSFDAITIDGADLAVPVSMVLST